GGYAFGIGTNSQLFLEKVGAATVNSDIGPTDTNWHHVAVVKSGSGVSFFVDGVQGLSGTLNQTFTFSNSVAIGAMGGSLTNTFLGAVDELAVYGRALSIAEIQAIYGARSSGKCVVAVPPFIVNGPTNQSVLTGNNATFNVLAAGSAPLFYQWR